VETTVIKVLKILDEYGPLDPSTIKRISGSTYTYKALKKLEYYGLVECGWLCKLTEKGKAALQYLDECCDVGCLSAKVDTPTA
jgi:DNA-binding PadR family transcriptional regulator